MKTYPYIFLFISLIIISVNSPVYSYSCLKLFSQLKKISRSEELWLFEKEFKQKYKKKYDKECDFYLGKKYYELRQQDKSNLENAERLLKSASEALPDSDNKYAATYNYLLLIEIEKQTPKIENINEYYGNLKNRLSKKENNEIQQKISKALGKKWPPSEPSQVINKIDITDATMKDSQTNQQNSIRPASQSSYEHAESINNELITLHKNMPEYDECSQFFNCFHYEKSKNCFEMYQRQSITNRKHDKISQYLHFLEDIIKRKETIINNYNTSCDEKTYTNNLSAIDSWFRYKGDLGKTHWSYTKESSDEDHNNRFKVINILAYSRCQTNLNKISIANEILKQAQKLKSFFIKDELSQYKKFLSQANMNNNNEANSDKDLIDKAPKFTAKHEKIRYNLGKDDQTYEIKAWAYFNKYLYDEAIDKLTFGKYNEKNYKRYKDLYKKINFINKIKDKKNKLKNSYEVYCHYNTNKSNIKDINQWFDSYGELSPKKFDYPNDSPASDHEKHFNALNWLYFAECRDKQQTYLSWLDIYKQTEKYNKYYDLSSAFEKYININSTKEAEAYLNKIGICEEETKDSFKLKKIKKFISLITERFIASNAKDQIEYYKLLNTSALCMPLKDRKKLLILIKDLMQLYKKD